MIILPAIDLVGGRCVRLRQGRFDDKTVFDEDPVAVARRFEAAGATWLHVVDLDGARDGEPKNLDTIRKIVEAVGLSVEVGGGIRTDEAAAAILDMGVRRVVLGTRAVREPEWLREVARKFPGRVALGLDAKGGRVAVAGWQESTAHTAAAFMSKIRRGGVSVAGLPLAAIIYTDIAKDGMMSGPNVEATAEVVKASPFPVIASGGVTTVEDVRRLKDVGVHGAIIGRALYEGAMTLEAALAAARDG